MKTAILVLIAFVVLLGVCGCDTARLTQPIYQEKQLPPGDPNRMDTVVNPQDALPPFPPRTEKEQKSVESHISADSKKRVAIAKSALAGSIRLEKECSLPHLSIQLPGKAVVVLITADHGIMFCLRLTIDGVDRTDAKQVQELEGIGESSCILYRPSGLPASTVVIDTKMGTNRPGAPPPGQVGRITIYYKVVTK